MKFDIKRILICVGATLIIILAVFQMFQDETQVNMSYEKGFCEGE